MQCLNPFGTGNNFKHKDIISSSVATVLIPSVQGTISNSSITMQNAIDLSLNPFGTGNNFKLNKDGTTDKDTSLNPFGTGNNFKHNTIVATTLLSES